MKEWLSEQKVTKIFSKSVIQKFVTERRLDIITKREIQFGDLRLVK